MVQILSLIDWSKLIKSWCFFIKKFERFIPKINSSKIIHYLAIKSPYSYLSYRDSESLFKKSGQDFHDISFNPPKSMFQVIDDFYHFFSWTWWSDPQKYYAVSADKLENLSSQYLREYQSVIGSTAVDKCPCGAELTRDSIDHTPFKQSITDSIAQAKAELVQQVNEIPFIAAKNALQQIPSPHTDWYIDKYYYTINHFIKNDTLQLTKQVYLSYTTHINKAIQDAYVFQQQNDCSRGKWWEISNFVSNWVEPYYSSCSNITINITGLELLENLGFWATLIIIRTCLNVIKKYGWRISIDDAITYLYFTAYNLSFWVIIIGQWGRCLSLGWGKLLFVVIMCSQVALYLNMEVYFDWTFIDTRDARDDEDERRRKEHDKLQKTRRYTNITDWFEDSRPDASTFVFGSIWIQAPEGHKSDLSLWELLRKQIRSLRRFLRIY